MGRRVTAASLHRETLASLAALAAPLNSTKCHKLPQTSSTDSKKSDALKLPFVHDKCYHNNVIKLGKKHCVPQNATRKITP